MYVCVCVCTHVHACVYVQVYEWARMCVCLFLCPYFGWRSGTGEISTSVMEYSCNKVLGWSCTADCPFNSFRTLTGFFQLRRVSPEDQYWNSTPRLMQSEFPFQRWWLVWFHNNTVFFTIYNNLLYSLHIHKLQKRPVEKYKSYGTLSKTTHFLSVFCEAGVAQQCTEAQASVVQDELS